jgi:hypothetical protein
MTENPTQKIAATVKEVAGNPNYDKERLESLINSIISETSESNTKFRIEVDGLTESPYQTKSLRITDFKHDILGSRITLKIQLAGQNEKWLVSIYLKKDLHSKKASAKFLKEARNAARALCDEENKRLAAQKQKAAAPADPAADHPSDKKAEGVEPKKRIKISSLITTKVIAQIVRVWMEKYSGRKKLIQKELWKVLEGTAVSDANRISVLNFLEKQGVVKKTTPIPRQSFVELTNKAFTILEENKKQEEEERLAAEKAKLTREALAFSGKSLSSLKSLQAIFTLQAEVDDIRAQKAEIAKQILGLEQVLEKLEQSEAIRTEKIEKAVRSIQTGKLAVLIETAVNIKTNMGKV